MFGLRDHALARSWIDSPQQMQTLGFIRRTQLTGGAVWPWERVSQHNARLYFTGFAQKVPLLMHPSPRVNNKALYTLFVKCTGQNHQNQHHPAAAL